MYRNMHKWRMFAIIMSLVFFAAGLMWGMPTVLAEESPIVTSEPEPTPEPTSGPATEPEPSATLIPTPAPDPSATLVPTPTPEPTVSPENTLDSSYSEKVLLNELTTFGGGDGTPENPYLIRNSDDLHCLAGRVNLHDPLYYNKYYKQINDIDLSGFNNWWPIGSSHAFEGVYDGNNKQIVGLTIDDNVDITSAYGLFGYCEGTVKNVNLILSSINIRASSGFLKNTGGISGVLYSNGLIENCYFSGKIIVSENYNSYTGGLVGDQNGGTITKCYNEGFINGSNVGGIVGIMDGVVSDCYNTGVVYGKTAGGIAGSVQYYGSLENSYNIGSIGGTMVGGISGGVNEGSISNSLCIDSVVYAVAGDYSSQSMKRTEFEMRDQNTYAGFNFEDTWILDNTNGYPYPLLISNMQTHFPEYNTSEFFGGRGTSYSPFIVQSEEQMDNIRKYPWAYFTVENNIQITVEKWIPIGENVSPFFGVIDGNQNSINGLNITEAEDNIGLFGVVTGGTIKNINVTDCLINVNNNNSSIYAGGIAGKCNGNIINCHVTGSINMTTPTSDSSFLIYSGGITGYENKYGFIKECSFSGSIYISSHITSVGGIGSMLEF